MAFKFGSAGPKISSVGVILMLMSLLVYVGAAVVFYAGLIRSAKPMPESIAALENRTADGLHPEVVLEQAA